MPSTALVAVARRPLARRPAPQQAPALPAVAAADGAIDQARLLRLRRRAPRRRGRVRRAPAATAVPALARGRARAHGRVRPLSRARAARRVRRDASRARLMRALVTDRNDRLRTVALSLVRAPSGSRRAAGAHRGARHGTVRVRAAGADARAGGASAPTRGRAGRARAARHARRGLLPRRRSSRRSATTTGVTRSPRSSTVAQSRRPAAGRCRSRRSGSIGDAPVAAGAGGAAADGAAASVQPTISAALVPARRRLRGAAGLPRARR